MPVPVSSDLSQSGEGEPPPRGYRPPPPGYGSPYPPYGFPPGHPYGPPHGYSPHHGPPGYPPHHHPHSQSHPSASAYSPPPGYQGGRPMYAYSGAFEGGGPPPPGSPGFPMQQSRDGRSKTPPFQRPSPRGSTNPARSSASVSSQRSSPVSRRDALSNSKSSPEQLQPPVISSSSQPKDPQHHHLGNASSSVPASLSHRSSPTKAADDMETERLRQAALTEISPSEVAPIKTAFHFFVLDMRDSLRPLAQEEVRRSTSKRHGEPLDPYLVNSNLNCRLMKAWEDLSEEDRQACMSREEADRRRFMEEEEIASRHCATLTARSKSPKTPERRNTNNSDNRGTPNPSPTSLASNPEPSPSPIASRLSAEPPSMDNDEKKVDDSDMERIMADDMTMNDKEHRLSRSPLDDDNEGASKRPSPTKTDEKGGSPPKRNRMDDGVEVKVEEGHTGTL